MRINEVIREYRKKENLTQEQVANYLNISVPAVNKWENGISYPDITLLAPLARILKINIDTLLSFNEELTDTEINNFIKEVGEIAANESFEKAFEKGSLFIKEYSNCDELLLNIATVLSVYLITSKIKEKEKYERKIISWLELAAGSSTEKIASMAKISLTAIYREKEEYEKAQKLLDTIPEPGVDKKLHQALIFESSGKIEEAYGVYESVILKDANEIYTALSLMIKQMCKEEKLDEAEEYSNKTKKIVDALEMGEYNKHSLDLLFAIEKKDKEKTIEIFQKMVDATDSLNDFMKSCLYKHIKFNFNPLDEEETKKYREMLKKSIKKSLKEDKSLDFIKDDPRIKAVLD